MYLTVLREHHWPPEVLDALFLDKKDYKGLIYLYNDIVAVNDELNKGKKGKK